MTDQNTELSLEERNFDAHFGVCPHCGRHDGYINVGRGHWMLCKEHRVKWFVGSNLFSSWKWETEEEQLEIYNKLGVADYQEISCEEAHSHPLVQQYQRDLDR